MESALNGSPAKPRADGSERRLQPLLFGVWSWGIAAEEILLKGHSGLPARETQADQSYRLARPGSGFEEMPAGAKEGKVVRGRDRQARERVWVSNG